MNITYIAICLLRRHVSGKKGTFWCLGTRIGSLLSTMPSRTRKTWYIQFLPWLHLSMIHQYHACHTHGLEPRFFFQLFVAVQKRGEEYAGKTGSEAIIRTCRTLAATVVMCIEQLIGSVHVCLNISHMHNIPQLHVHVHVHVCVCLLGIIFTFDCV